MIFATLIGINGINIIKESLERVKSILKKNEDKLSTLAKELIEKETMSGNILREDKL